MALAARCAVVRMTSSVVLAKGVSSAVGAIAVVIISASCNNLDLYKGRMYAQAWALSVGGVLATSRKVPSPGPAAEISSDMKN